MPAPRSTAVSAQYHFLHRSRVWDVLEFFAASPLWLFSCNVGQFCSSPLDLSTHSLPSAPHSALAESLTSDVAVSNKGMAPLASTVTVYNEHCGSLSNNLKSTLCDVPRHFSDTVRVLLLRAGIESNPGMTAKGGTGQLFEAAEVMHEM